MKIRFGKEAAKALEVVRRFLPAGVDLDDVETPEDTAAHIQAMQEYKAGETMAFEDINWN